MSHKKKKHTDAEEIQLLSLKPKQHNPAPKKVIANVEETLTADIVWGDSITRCFLYSCLVIFVIIIIIIIHGAITPNTTVSNNNKHNLITESSATSKSTSNPHIIWFIFDDLGQSDFSHHLSEYSTPNIDSLALNGIELIQHYVSPICSATRSSLLTGRYAYSMGLQGVTMDWIHPTTIAHIPSKFKTVGNHFKSINYNTKLYGKWHAGYSKKSYTPLGRGFDSAIGYYQYAIQPFTKFNLDGWSDAKDWFVDGLYTENTDYSTQILLDSILNDINSYNADEDDPLFMYIALTNPHFPVLTPVEFNKKHISKCAMVEDIDRKSYCLSVQYLDYAIGEIVNALKENDLYSNSLIAATTDNGAQIKDLCGNPGGHVAAGSMYPLRGGKYTLFQGGVLTPAFISGALVNQKYHGTTSNLMISSVDWLPTLLHFTDFYDTQDLDAIDGMDQYDALFNDDVDELHNLNMGEREHLILSMQYNEDTEHYYNTAIIYQKHKLLLGNRLILSGWDGSCDIRSPKPGVNPFTATVINPTTTTTPNMMLFNLEKDPNEYVDLLYNKGSEYFKINPDHTKIQTLIDEMHNILDDARLNKVKVLKTQNFELVDMDVSIDAYGISGAHIPWQTEDELEFPDGYDY